MRRHVLRVLAENGLDCSVRDIGSDELDEFGGMLICNSQFGVLPVRSCGEKRLPQSKLAGQVAGIVAASGIREYAS
jgi:branched-subunit amino acid aminotransferase/4-amino-4-deoxychorismate lyase